jgi:hypothetical protein
MAGFGRLLGGVWDEERCLLVREGLYKLVKDVRYGVTETLVGLLYAKVILEGAAVRGTSCIWPDDS